jgi:chromosome partitioning protein
MKNKPAIDIEMGFGERFGGRLFLVPGSRGLNSVKMRFDTEIQSQLAAQEITELDADAFKDRQRQGLAKSLQSLRGKRDFVIIDTAPDLGFILTTCLIAADRYLIPIIPSGYDMDGLTLLLKAIAQVRQRYQPELKRMGVLLSKFKRTNLDEDVKKMLKDNPGDVFDTTISDSVRHREATFRGETIVEYARGEQAAEQFLSLADEVLQRLGMPRSVQAANDLKPVVLATEPPARPAMEVSRDV